MFVMWAVAAALLFFTIGSRTGQPDTGCSEMISKGYAIDCENRSPKGWPMTYRYEGDVSSSLIWPGAFINAGLWIVVSGVAVFGSALILPERRKM
jgi:hypothetical protein